MFNLKKIKILIYLLLVFAVCSTKNIFIYNEETLVAISFFCFLFFILHYFGDTIKDSLNERSGAIGQELEHFLILKEHSFQELLSQHQKVAGLTKALGTLNSFTRNILESFHTPDEKALKNLFRDQMENELRTLAFSRGMVQQKLQSKLSLHILSTVLVALPAKGGKSQSGVYQKQAIEKAIDCLIMDAQKKG
jgi:hypothetical protein